MALDLTDRERDVVALVATGLPAKGVAAKLGIGVRTAKRAFASARRKVGAETTAQAAAWHLLHVDERAGEREDQPEEDGSRR